MHDHEIRGVFRYEGWDRVHPVGVPDARGDTHYIPMQYITGIDVAKSGALVTVHVAGGREYLINRGKTIERFFEEYSAYQAAHERGL
jgi:hypothetical protein